MEKHTCNLFQQNFYFFIVCNINQANFKSVLEFEHKFGMFYFGSIYQRGTFTFTLNFILVETSKFNSYSGGFWSISVKNLNSL